jgi:hypothetical protein
MAQPTKLEQRVQYFENKGFEILPHPPINSRSYVTLNQLSNDSFQSEIRAHHPRTPVSMHMNQLHPSLKGHTTEKLVDRVEDMVYRGKGDFTPESTTPIGIVIVDPAWKPVADALVAKYQ